jgi:hypothetical protein
VYYFSDVSDEESASYIGVIVVKQKCESHILEYNPEAKNFGSGNTSPTSFATIKTTHTDRSFSLNTRSHNNGNWRLHFLEMDSTF